MTGLSILPGFECSRLWGHLQPRLPTKQRGRFAIEPHILLFESGWTEDRSFCFTENPLVSKQVRDRKRKMTGGRGHGPNGISIKTPTKFNPRAYVTEGESLLPKAEL